MLLDASEIAHDTILQTDLCIVGAGASGISFAREFIGAPLDVCLIEGGGLTEERTSQSLNRGFLDGLPYHDLDEARWRVFGGSTGRWAGWCRPLDPIDFEERPWVPLSGWPFDLEDLEPYYRKAQELVQIPTYAYEPDGWGSAVPQLYRPPFSGGPIETAVWQGSPPTKFGAVYVEELTRAPNIKTILHGNAIELEAEPESSRVSGLRVSSLAGRTFKVMARTYVLTCGAIDTTRLLLGSNSTRSAGLGNEHDNVGRYFMEHPHVTVGRLVVDRRASRSEVPAVDRGFAGARERLNLQRPSHGIKCAFKLTDHVQRAEGLLNFSAHLNTLTPGGVRDSDGYKALKLIVTNLRSMRRLASQVRNRALPAGVARQIGMVLKESPSLTRAIYHEIAKRPTELAIYAQAEQSPNRASRVRLADQRDAVGVPLARLDWRMTQLDKISIRRSLELLGDHLAQTGIGRVEPAEWLTLDDESWGPDLIGGMHHLGTARMSASARDGVVDATGRLHSIDNVYVADGSVLPTGGFSNPALTIVAVALKIAGHVRNRLIHRLPPVI